MIYKVVFARVRAVWRTLDQLSKFIVKFVSIDLSDVSGEICGLIERLSVLPFLVEVRERLRCKSPRLHDFALLLSVQSCYQLAQINVYYR